MTNSDEIIAHGNINNMFTYHAPNASQIQRYQVIRDAAKQLGHTIINCCPNSRERSAAITLLQNAVMMANAAIAINEKDQNEESQIGKAIAAKAQAVTEKLQALRRVVENDPDFYSPKIDYPSVDPNLVGSAGLVSEALSAQLTFEEIQKRAEKALFVDPNK